MLPGSNPSYIRRLPWAFLTLLLASGYARSACALGDSDKEAIRGLSNDAAADFRQEKYETARDKFARAYALAKVPKLAVWVARTQARLGNLVSAYEHYRQAVRLERNELWVGDSQEQAKKEAEQELVALIPRLAKVVLVVEGAPAQDVEVSIDGVVVPSSLLGIERYIDPGAREITATRGAVQLREMMTLPEGGARNVVLRFDSTATGGNAPSSTIVVATAKTKSASATPTVRSTPQPSAGSAQRTWGWVGVGVGAAGLLTGAVSGLVVAAKYDDLKDDCGDGTCDAKYSGQLDSYRSMRTLSWVGFVVGGVGSAVGVTLLLTSPTHVESPAGIAKLGVWVSPAMAGLRGEF